MIGLSGIVLLVALGALCALDTVSLFQSMVSRPIVSAAIAGALFGRAEDTIVVGAVLELFAIETMPFGASRYPEWGSAGVVAGVTYLVGGPGTSGSLAVATLAGLATALLGSVSMVWHRQFVARIATTLRDRIAAGSASAVARLHFAGIVSDFWRGTLVTAVGLMLALLVAPRIVRAWYLPFGPSAAWPVILGVAAAGASIVRSAHAVPRASWLLAGGSVIGLGLVFAR
jgi:mannose/fructose/N-acetylgalactosamine-specific phosphotransferase system component IIC